MNELMLREVNPYDSDLKSSVMSRAAELRDEGYDRSEALSEAWSEVGDYGDYTDYKPRRSNPKKETMASMSPSLLLVVGYGAWVLYNRWRTGAWKWIPWSLARPALRPQPIQKVIPARTTETQQVAIINPRVAHDSSQYYRR